MTEQEFEEKLKGFDWYYAMSDEFGKYQRGHEAEKKLLEEATELGYLDLFMQYYDERQQKVKDWLASFR